ncbi:hypothetical protein COU14_00850 [Candidatus Kaiserbacteria bacterium CG10_big_fil_rev_8_21_14_0_10_44_10]|uniref:Nucleotidyltransferase n=1 Tax=Candidatus Kaiserbacteria bacterium CG10_big_fil_rev_8_21_14_0_10_44_10 TaxID=1974606 RepID=A0A2H0UI73_9BACT|nr:MAG: hypothetical protein COU14_00850 [Candidatus Kaiserbacteria bacterium CG10_big_fil_rev_8_21_14_0_10_44_10]
MVGPIDVLQDVVTRFEKANIEYFLVGSLATMYYGRPRFTNDVDLVVQIKADQIQDFESLFPLEEYYCPPIEVLKDEVLRMGSFNLIHQASGIKIDVMLRKNTDHSRSEFSRRTKVKLAPQCEAYVASPEDVIIKKLDFYREGGSEKHLIDIREILAGAKVDKTYIEDWVNRLGLLTEWEKV